MTVDPPVRARRDPGAGQTPSARTPDLRSIPRGSAARHGRAGSKIAYWRAPPLSSRQLLPISEEKIVVF
jgi:hypothetical protein